MQAKLSDAEEQSGPSTTELSTSSLALPPRRTTSNVDVNARIKPHRTRHPSINQDQTPTGVAQLTHLLENTHVNTATAGMESIQRQSPASSTGKNARKKKKKQLTLNMSNTGHNQMPVYGSPNSSSVHDFFSQGGSPFTNTGARFVENMRHHPHFQYIQSMQSIEMQQVTSIPIPRSPQAMSQAASMPNTPLIHLYQRPGSVSIPCSPLANPQLNIPFMQNMFYQNMMQHPLLSQAYNNTNVQNHNHTPSPKSKNESPKNKKKKKGPIDEKKFHKYMPEEEMVEGLKNNTLIEGIIRINPKQFQHAYISNDDRDEQDVFIDGLKNRNRALEGDIVVVQLIESDSEEIQENPNTEQKSTTEQQPTTELKSNTGQESKQRRGKVVFIKEKVHTRTCIGNLKLMPDKNRQRALFIPRDHRIPRLNIPFTCWPDNFYQDAKNYENTLFLAQIIEWSDTRFAVGKILKNIGQSGNMVTESMAILAQNDLDVTPFGPEVRDLFPRLDYKIPIEEIAKREDCRKLCIFSIDPSNCRDIDDAVSCRELENGNYEVGVHISDVAHYLQENTILDEKVAEKATTIYLVEKAYHMLPDELCMLCSLFPGVDKLAFSVFWEITKDAKVLSHRFAKTVINSCCQLAYDHAQAILEDRDDAAKEFPETYNGFQFVDIQKSIRIIGGMASTFRKNRFDGGALRIDQVKVNFHLSPANGLPESFMIYENKESHQMIEEFMLLANMSVAKRIHDDHPQLAFLRCHPPPSGFMLKQLVKSLKPMGIELDIASAGDLHRSLMPYVGPDSLDKGRAMVLNMLCAKPMARAKYFCAAHCEDEDFHHYALNVPLYTHFTSPIRRYADIMVHR